MSGLKVGMIGLDTSHVVAFTQLLNDTAQDYYVPGGKVVVAFPGGSADFALSISRVDPFTKKLQHDYGVQIVSSPEAVAEKSDAILLESADGRVHPEQFRKIVPYQKPVFIDKPFSLSTEEAKQMIALADRYNTPVMSTSALRFAEGLQDAVYRIGPENVIGSDCFGPMGMQDTQPGYFWYGIHAVEMLFTILGGGCVQVTATSNDDHDLIVGVWGDGRVGTVRGNRKGNERFGALIHSGKGTEYVDVYAHPKPYYASLLEKVIDFFQAGESEVALRETLEIIRFIEAANSSREYGKPIYL